MPGIREIFHLDMDNGNNGSDLRNVNHQDPVKMLMKDGWGRELKSEVIIHNEDAPDSTGTFSHR